VERRYVIFIILAFLMLVTNKLVVDMFSPRRPEVALDKAGKAAEEPAVPTAEGEQAPAGDAAADKTTAEKPDDAAKPDDEAGTKPDAETAETPQAEEKIAVQRISLGSYAVDSGYRLLVTLNNQGAAVERVELTSPQYRDLEDRSGYLGHLAPTDGPKGGCQLQVVGRGTPADLAGLKPGDTITRFNSAPIDSAADFVTALAATQAEQTAKLSVERRPGAVARSQARSPAAGNHSSRTRQ